MTIQEIYLRDELLSEGTFLTIDMRELKGRRTEHRAGKRDVKAEMEKRKNARSCLELGSRAA